MNRDREWERWRQAWTSGAGDAPPEAPEALRARVERQTRRMLLCQAGEIAFGVLFVALWAVYLWRHPEPRTWVVMIAVMSFMAVAVWHSISSRQGQWRPAGDSTRAFLDLSRRRCGGKLKSLAFAWRLYLAEVIFLVAYGIWRFPAVEQDERAWRYGTASAVLLLLGGVMWIFVRNRRRAIDGELAFLDRLAREAIDP